jgi:hypothetical protein
MNLEVWFPQRDSVSVSLESFVADDEVRFHETCVFALFAARQIANGRGDWAAQSLASTLMTIHGDDPLADLLAGLGNVRLVAPSGGAGRKGFTAEYRPENRTFFKVHFRGMGFLGKDASEYAPASALALLAHLLGPRSEDAEYQNALASAAQLIGLAGSQGALTVRAQSDIALHAAAGGWMADGLGPPAVGRENE